MFGFIVSRAVGSAVVRNRLRRQMKAIVERRLREDTVGIDMVLRALPVAKGANFAELERDLNRLIDRAERAAKGCG